MSEINNKMENFIDSEIKNKLQTQLSDSFTDRVMREVELTGKFAKEDKKIHKIAIYFSIMFSLAIFTVVGFISFFSSTSSRDETTDLESKLSTSYNTITEFTDKFMIFTNSWLTKDVLLYTAGITLVIGLFVFADKLLFARTGKQN